MSYQYPAESLPLQWSSASISTPCYGQFDPTWTASLDGMQDPCADLDYWREVSWDQVDVDMQSPLDFALDNQSPTMGSNPMSSYTSTHTRTSSSQSSMPQLATRNSTTGSEDGSTQDQDDSRVNRRRIQNRNSQRAYRERTKQKEEQMSSVIQKLQEEIDVLRKREKGSTEMIEALTREVERLKKKGLILHYRPT